MKEELICKICGPTDEFLIKQSGPHLTAYCEKCNSYIKHLPKSKITEKILPFGKYIGTKISEMWDEEQINYLRWLVEQDFLKQDLRNAVGQHLFNIKKQ
jgi:uncharacterized protein (DUF3820 family)